MPAKGPIPAHLLGNIWAQDWSNIYPLVAPAELALMHQLRRALGGQDRKQSLQQLLEHLKATGTNAEFLRRAARG